MNRFVFLSICICAAVTAHPDIEDPLQVLSVGNRQFAVAIYKELLKENKDNIVFSPLSAEVILALTSEGAKGDTRTELVNGLYLPQAPGEIQKCFKEVLPQLQVNNDNVKLFSANKMYARNDVEFEKEFKQIAVDVFKSDIENVDFHQVAKACDTINEWVEGQTNHKIKNLLSPDVVSTDTVLILVNTLYLNAKWISSFDEVATTNENFFLTSTKTVEKPIMQKVQYTNYHESKELKAQFLELPYQLDGLSMVFVLPDDTDGLATLENNIEAVFQPREWQKETVSIKLPRFTINSGINFNDILKSLGVKKLFNDADLTGLSVNYKDLTVSQVVQKAFINVTEGGTEAAAATAVISFIRSGHALPVVTKTFHATHPFIYLIKYYDLILFAGKYSS